MDRPSGEDRLDDDTSLDNRQVLYASVEMLVEIVTGLSRKTGLKPNDLMVVFGVILCSAPRQGTVSVINDDDDDYHWVSLLSLSSLVAIDRTTLRRRVTALHARGFVTYEPARGVRLSTGAMADPSLHRMVAQAAQTYADRLRQCGRLKL